MTMQVASKSPRGPLSFNVQLLSGKNVVLVNCQGYESELFMPQIVKGRISFQNIIPNRRCCDQANIITGPLPLNGAACIGTGGKPTLAGTPAIQRPTSISLARSTAMRSRPKRSKETISPPPHGAIMTPDQLRGKPAEVEFSIPEDLNPEELFSSFYAELPNQLRLSDGRNELNPGSSTHTPAQSLESTISSVIRKTPPVRTYSRRKTNATSKSKSSLSCSPLQKKKKISSKASTTKGLQATKTLAIRNRRLIVDNKKSLGSLSVSKLSSSITKKKTVHNQVTAKTRKQFESLKTTAFDLLTTPTLENISKTLNQQFQMACVDKIATTLPNYAQLAPTKPLEIDREVKTMIAKQKRLEKTNSKPKWI
ncbi:uncharacterized protein Dwil_GK15291 [Drosophila willistoni]|uniref:Uncharacterized protein n=1 Tax=Drosophila willistoni TaxID=7260 RepID=B4MWH8_DROWI|nr:uncharacterized protein LOC6642541 [Drosophila willistoni]EDW76119.1 uncharacterized protein Dwil_GK15291 [Drosophila willistoni]